MKAVVAPGDGSLKLQHGVPEPTLGPYDCRVRVEAFAFCNSTDQTIAFNRPPLQMQYPAILGHESVGVVTDIGRGVKSFVVGQRVLRPYATYLGEMLGDLHSAWGGFAEIGKIVDLSAMREAGEIGQADHLKQMSYQQAAPARLCPAEALLAIPWKEIYSSLEQVGPVDGQRVLIAGAGLTAVCFGLLLKMRGTCHVSLLARRESQRLEAQRLGAADDTLSSGEPIDAHPRFDVMIDTTGSLAFVRSQLSRLRDRGNLYAYAIYPELATDPDCFKDLESDFAFRRIDPKEADAEQAVAGLIAAGKLPCRELITHEYGINDLQAAWGTVTRRQTLKTVVHF